MKDEAEQKAETLLPCEFVTEHDKRECLPTDKGICDMCLVRPAIAAALREAQQDGYTKGWTAGNEEADALDAEIVKLREQLLEAQANQHDENCDTRDIMIQGKPCNCYVILKAELDAQLTEAWNLAVNPSAMRERLASISHAGWLALRQIAHG